ncbi:GvpL/GvpF family gas vesicle protein [Streptomyces peucetius]|uniref:GvpL/GvpF family gas vesicle protein n=1 Tax=Streptomyces peucetius TaxID=1950 RepID=A0ABY6I0H6_STRPE|nr:GvpL/GvpF family gas vesicle protein [Streptomyces peucetius]UYQ60264.1 GvpL/GvpF family gas vesicle protein [Streptomyces peucetius]
MSGLLYVYAVARPPLGGVPGSATGVGGGPVRPVEHDGLLAVVSDVRAEDFEEAPLRDHLEDLDWLADTARAHESVVRAVGEVTDLVPLRLATVCRGESGVRRLLDQGARLFAENLDRLAGRVEWGVKLYAAAEQETAPEPRCAPAEGPSSGRDYLRRRLRSRQSREQSWTRADALARRLHTELAGHAEAQRLHRPQSGQLARSHGVNVLNAAFLVRREDSEAFVGHVERLTPPEPGVRVELTGPWAPYSFADLSDTRDDGRVGA